MSAPVISALTPDDALQFFDEELTVLPRGVDLVRVLVGGEQPRKPVRVDADHEHVLLPRLAYHRLLPQLQSSITNGQLATSDGFARYVDGLSTHLAMGGLRLERMLLDVDELFAEADVEFLVLKGVATGRLDHPKPGLRQAGDVDILVRLDDVERARRTLAAGGFLRPDAVSTLMDKGETWSAPIGVSLDVHTRPHTAGRALGEDWWDRSDVFRVAGASSGPSSVAGGWRTPRATTPCRSRTTGSSRRSSIS